MKPKLLFAVLSLLSLTACNEFYIRQDSTVVRSLEWSNGLCVLNENGGQQVLDNKECLAFTKAEAFRAKFGECRENKVFLGKKDEYNPFTKNGSQTKSYRTLQPDCFCFQSDARTDYKRRIFLNVPEVIVTGRRYSKSFASADDCLKLIPAQDQERAKKILDEI